MVMIKPSIHGSLAFMCLVEGTSPVLLSVGLPNSMLYADGAFTTRYLIFFVREAKPFVKVVLNSIYPLTLIAGETVQAAPIWPQLIRGQL